MKNLLTQFALYNLWANNQFTTSIRSLPSVLHTQLVTASFPSLEATLLHLLDAESMWWQRMKLAETIVRPSASGLSGMEAISKSLLSQSKEWANWVMAVQDRMLEHEFIYRNTKRQMFKQPVYQVLLHVFNHSTYHRGQLVTMLRQLGIINIPETDFIIWSRSKK